MGEPQVSVCVPIRNGATFLARTLSTILDQRGVSFEVVALDNASTDRTPEILAEHADPRLRVVRNETLLPIAENWRKVTELASAPMIKLVCADDLVVTRSALADQCAVLVNHPEVSLVAARRNVIDDRDRIIHPRRGLRALIGRHPGQSVARMMAWTGINPIGESAAVMFRRADYDAVGGWNPELTYPLDIQLWFDLLRRGDLFGLRQTQASYRMSNLSLTSHQSPQQFAEQRQFLARMTTDPHWRLRRPEQWASRVAGPIAFKVWGLRHRLRP